MSKAENAMNNNVEESDEIRKESDLAGELSTEALISGVPPERKS